MPTKELGQVTVYGVHSLLALKQCGGRADAYSVSLAMDKRVKNRHEPHAKRAAYGALTSMTRQGFVRQVKPQGYDYSPRSGPRPSYVFVLTAKGKRMLDDATGLWRL